jgi:putative spermidine/putrescine transport system substrate-binding protein
MSTEPVQRRVEELSTSYMTGQLSRRRFVAGLVGLGLSLPIANAILAACSSGGSSPAASVSGSAPAGGSPAAAASLEPAEAALLAAAKAEGTLYLTGIPPEWANYQGQFDTWDALTGIKRDGITTEGEYTSGQELDSIKNTGKPDVGDVGLPFGPTAKTGGLVQNYMHAHWADVDASLKDADGAYCTAYYGAEAFVINTDAVKLDIKDWKDLLDPSLKNAVGIDGDPTKASDSFNAVWSAAFANGGGVDDIGPGVDWFKQLQAAGNLTPARCTQAALQSGEVKVGIKWDYLGLGDRDKFNGAPNIKVVVPPSGSVTGPYVAIITAKAPHPNAAKLWNELMFSDTGQLNFLKGYARPARYDKLVAAGKVPADLAAKLPSPDSYKNVKFITDSAKVDAAKAKLTTLWNIVVNS